MPRVRVSTTVDAENLTAARRLLPGPDHQLLDRALLALIHQLEVERDLLALTHHPYEDDPDLAWQAPIGPDLPYDGEIPDDVVRLAEQRRGRS